MPTDPKIDAYIAAQQPFAQPILHHLRALVHASVPGVQETIKWSRPFFTIDGRPLCFLAAFKAHAGFGVWQGLGGATGHEAEGAGSFGRLTSLDDLPPDAELRSIVAAAAKQAMGERPVRPRAAPKAALPIPADLERALAPHPDAATCLAALPPGQRREYLEWIGEAKRPETRARRIATAVERLAAGETLNARHARR